MTSTASATDTQRNVFDVGQYETLLRTVETGTCTTKSKLPVPPPKPLLIAMPSDAGEFPLLVFLHGYFLYNSFYSQLIQHIASHGFIVIAPQASLSLSLTQICTIYLIQMLYLFISFNKYI
jgi:chlorophyllase